LHVTAELRVHARDPQLIANQSWEAAARAAIETAARTVRDLRVAEVVKLDLTIDENRVTSYRARLNISFKYERGE
jgi:flavin-binding protein dodecin